MHLLFTIYHLVISVQWIHCSMWICTFGAWTDNNFQSSQSWFCEIFALQR